MENTFVRTKCKCDECPLNGQKKVIGRCGIEKPKVAIFGGEIGEAEDELGEPFVQVEGAKIKEVVSTAGLIWHTLWKSKVIICDVESVGGRGTLEGKIALECCIPGFVEEVKWLEKQGVNVLVPMGQVAMTALGIEGKIGKYRGSVFPRKRAIVIPTYGYEFFVKGMWKEEPTWINDFAKVRELSLKKYVALKEDFNLFPSEKDVKDFVEEALKTKALVAVDIETTSLDYNYSKILMIGMAMSSEKAIVVPFTKVENGKVKDYWSMVELSRVNLLLKKVLKEARTMFQNAAFDTMHLEHHGYPVGNLEHDTMLLHHCLSPELAHNLGYIVSVYGSTPYWKEVVLGSEDKMMKMDDKTVRTYNARDTVVLHQILPEMLKHLQDVGTEKTYREVEMKLVKPLRKMTMNGLPLDQKELKKNATRLKKETEKLKGQIFELMELPEGFNLNSREQMLLLLYGIKPVSWKRILSELEEYESNKKKNKNTKKYVEMVLKKELIESIKTMYVPRLLSVPKKPSTDAEAILNIQKACITREAVIAELKRKSKDIEQEKEELRKTVEFVKMIREYTEKNKLVTTFSGFPYGKDGRVHPNYKIHGTATGRLSSDKPNAQNFPKSVLNVFRPDNASRVIVKADYSNIEFRVLGYISGEQNIIEAFESGQNMHDVNTRLLFGIEKDHPMWKDARQAAKIYIFGRSYGGSVEGIYEQIIVAVPDLKLTLAHFRKLDAAFFEKLSSYKMWCEKVIKQARTTRTSENAFGRVRFLLGTPNEIERQALNNPIQGTAGEITERAIIELDERLEREFEKAFMIGTVHDSILVECFKNDSLRVAKVMKQVMERKFDILGKMVSFPVDIEIGPSWGETEVVKV